MKPEPSLSVQKRKAREIVVKALYEMEMGGLDQGEVGENISRKCRRPEIKEFALRLLGVTLDHLQAVDDIIVKVAENWDIERMAVIDRNLLRMGIAEILFLDDVPEKVTINEAIEIAKKFSTEKSGKFVNGVLDKVARTKGDLRSNF
jgi:transcription antitermination factor NusB